jgi:hypothetical protein
MSDDNDMNMYGVNNNSSSSFPSSFSYLMEEENDEIISPTNLKKQTIPVTIYHIEKQLEFFHNEIKEINNRLEKEILSTKDRFKIKSKEIVLSKNLKVFKNGLIQLNKKINDYIF